MKRKPRPPEMIPFRGRASSPQRNRRVADLSWIAPELWNCFRGEGTDAHRIASGAGTWLERFGDDLLLSFQSEDGRDQLLADLDARCAKYDYSPRRVFGKHLPHHAAERGAPNLLRGESALPLATEVTEAQVRFGLDFAAGYSAGLFIDQRANRARIRQGGAGRMLNTFAYTCSFSVVGALGGGKTFSIDLSRRSLQRGEENFRRNGIDPAGHQFIADDVLAVLPRLARRGEKFDVIILDPPTFSRNQAGAAFQVQRDFDQLVAGALDVAAPSAKLLLSVNHSEMRGTDLERMARAALRIRNRSGRFQASPALPDLPAGHGAKTLWLELNS